MAGSVLALAGCGSGEPSETVPATTDVSEIATDLDVPWGIDFLPDGDALVTERNSGRIVRVSEDGQVTEEQTIPSVNDGGEDGVLGIAVSPDYEKDGLVYVYYTTPEDNRVARFKLGERPEPILTGINANWNHDGGRIRFGPDGKLYVTTGDAGDPDSAQDPDSLNGKILRIEPDGSIPKDNPDPGSPVYSLGHRNVEGITWDAEGRLYATEFGESDSDEVNLIEPGGNYGWPEVEGKGGEPEFIDPITTWSPGDASPAGGEILVDSAVSEWNGDMLVAALAGERLWRLDLDESGKLTGRTELFNGEYGRLRNVVQAPDGSVWISTSNRDGRGEPEEGDDRILRIGG
jgi:glucose/arabinose dehydrogenase